MATKQWKEFPINIRQCFCSYTYKSNSIWTPSESTHLRQTSEIHSVLFSLSHSIFLLVSAIKVSTNRYNSTQCSIIAWTLRPSHMEIICELKQTFWNPVGLIGRQSPASVGFSTDCLDNTVMSGRGLNGLCGHLMLHTDRYEQKHNITVKLHIYTSVLRSFNECNEMCHLVLMFHHLAFYASQFKSS